MKSGSVVNERCGHSVPNSYVNRRRLSVQYSAPAPGPSARGARCSKFWARLCCAAILLAAASSIAADAGMLYLRVSQVGYHPQDVKVAVAFSKSPLPPSFVVLDANSQKVLLRAKVKPLRRESW
jgi:hypothetical protein